MATWEDPGPHTSNSGSGRGWDPGGRVSGGSGSEPQERQSWWPFGHEGGVPEGVIEIGINGDVPSDISVATARTTHPYNLQGQGGAVEGGVG